jgi:hypothetical protein
MRDSDFFHKEACLFKMLLTVAVTVPDFMQSSSAIWQMPLTFRDSLFVTQLAH